MSIYSKRKVVAIALLLVLFAMPGFASAQETKLLTSANGKGTVKVGQEEFKVTAVVVKLLDDGNAELSLVSEITIFLSGKWSENSGDPNSIDIQLTGGATGGGVQGTGKLVLRDDRKSLATLNLSAVNKSSKRNIVVSFTAN